MGHTTKKNSNEGDSGRFSFAQANSRVRVNIRNVQRKGRQILSFDAATLGALKTKVVVHLQPSWEGISPAVVLQKENIRVFLLDGMELKPLLSSDGGMRSPDETPLSNAVVYFAVEYFQTVPTDMYRTIKNLQLRPATYSHPHQLTTEDRQWTTVSPVYCAAMKEEELGLPWHGVTATGSLHVNGISLYCKDETTDCSFAVNPYRPIEDNEKSERFATRLTLEQYATVVEEEGDGERHPLVGILETQVSHTGLGRANFMKGKMMPQSPKEEYGERKTKRLATKRSVYVRYKLRAGTQLGPYGMALVYDSSSNNPYHVSLIRERDVEPEREREWIVANHVFMPGEAYNEGITKKSSDERDRVLLESVLSPSEQHEEPEPASTTIDGVFYVAFPKVAALFVLHDLTMQAQAEPVPLQKFDEPSQKSMYWAALVLHRFDSDFQVRLAVEELEAAKYNVGSLDSPCWSTLRSAMEEALGRDDIITVELEEEAKLDPIEALEDGIGLLNELIQSSIQAKTPAPATLGALENDSPKSATQMTSSSTAASEPSNEAPVEPMVAEVTSSHSEDTNSSDVPNTGV